MEEEEEEDEDDEFTEKKCSPHKAIIIGQAVEFLQALLDMMAEQHIHMEVCIYIHTCMSGATCPFHLTQTRGGGNGRGFRNCPIISNLLSIT